MGADGIELDVNLSADGVPIVIHDRHLRRTTSGSGQVSAHSQRALQRLDAGSWFARRLALRPRARRLTARLLSEHRAALEPMSGHGVDFANEMLPTLADTLTLLTTLPTAANLQRLYIELKGEAATKAQLLDATLALVRRFKMERVVTLLSFDHDIIAQAKAVAPHLRAAVTLPASRRALVSARAIIQAVEAASADEAALHFGLASRRVVARLHERGIAVSVWTANHRVLMRRLLASGVDAIMTNYPNRLLETLAASR